MYRMIRYLLLVVLCSFYGSVYSQSLVLWHHDGSYTTIELVSKPKITLESGKICVNSKNLNLQFPQDEIARLTYKDVNLFSLIYMVDGALYKSSTIEYGAKITPEADPSKEGYTFSGWSEVPKTMPANDVTVTGTFKQVVYVINNIGYMVTNGEVAVSDGTACSRDVKIPASVDIDGTSYTVSAIMDGAFKDCVGLTSVSIPNSIKSIGVDAFNGCFGLTTITIGNGITSIGSKAFANVYASSSARTRADDDRNLIVFCRAESVPATTSDAFQNSKINQGLLIVSDKALGAYQTTTPWSGFGTILGETEYAGIKDIYMDSPETRIYDLQGNRLNTIHKGVNIIRTMGGKSKKNFVK